MISRRKARKHKLHDYQETGYRIRWKCNPPLEKDQINTWDDTFINQVENHNLYFCGGLGYDGGDGVIYKGDLTKTSPEDLSDLLNSLKELPSFSEPEVLGPFDINHGKYPLYPGETY
jgi:uncharacterized protein YggL (DUF469 family)